MDPRTLILQTVRWRILGLPFLAVVLLAACGDATGQERMTATAAATATLESPADTATPTAKPDTPTAEQAPEAAPSPSSTPTPMATPTPTVSPSPTAQLPAPTRVSPTTVPTATPPAELVEMQAAIEEVLGDIEGTVAVSLTGPDGAIIYELNADETMEAASIYKLAVMVEIYRQRESGVLSFDDTVLLVEDYYVEGPDSFGWDDVGEAADIETLLFTMIAQSSNIASYALLDLAGTENVNATMLELGLEGVEIRWSPGLIRPPVYDRETTEGWWLEDESPDEPPLDDSEGPTAATVPLAEWMSAGGQHVTATLRADAAFNVVTASDIGRLLVLMLNGDIVSEQASHEMLDLLSRQQIPGGLSIPLPDGSIAHKTGYLPDGVVNDAGIIFTERGPYVAVVLTESVREDIAYDVQSRIAVMLFEFGSR